MHTSELLLRNEEEKYWFSVCPFPFQSFLIYLLIVTKAWVDGILGD